MDLIYSHAPHPSTDPTNPLTKTPVDGIVRSIQPPSATKFDKQPSTSTITPSTPTISAEVNSIQTTQTPGNKKKGKGK